MGFFFFFWLSPVVIYNLLKNMNIYIYIYIYISGFVSDGGSIIDGFFHGGGGWGGGGGNSCGGGGGDRWLKKIESEKEINTNGGAGWERDWIGIILLGSYIILMS